MNEIITTDGLRAAVAIERAEKAEAKVTELEESLHYCNGAADLAMKHRNEAEANVARLEGRVAAITDKAENLVIAIGLGWDLDGCVEEMNKALAGDGSAIIDVVEAAQTLSVSRPSNDSLFWPKFRALLKTLDRLDNKEGG